MSLFARVRRIYNNTHQVIGNPVVHSYQVVGRRICCSVKTASETQNDLTHQGAAGRAVTSADHRGTVNKFQTKFCKTT